MADRKDRFTMLIFNSSGIICYRNRDYGVQGDPIYTAVFVTNPAEWNGVDNTFDPCALEPTAPAILASGNLEQIRAGFSAQRYSVRPFPPRSCFSAAVTIAVIGALKVPEGTPAQSVNFRTTLNQYERFRATLQVGVLNTPQHANNFGLRDSAGTKLIYNQGPSNRGPEYLASVVIFGLPRYLQTLTQGTQYSGRDVLHDNSLMDRIGAVVGTSLSNPGKRFAAGASLELLYGANALFVWDVAQTNRLSGVKEGAVWTAAAADLPIEKTWQSRFVLGLSLDIGYATKLFGK